MFLIEGATKCNAHKN